MKKKRIFSKGMQDIITNLLKETPFTVDFTAGDTAIFTKGDIAFEAVNYEEGLAYGSGLRDAHTTKSRDTKGEGDHIDGFMSQAKGIAENTTNDISRPEHVINAAKAAGHLRETIAKLNAGGRCIPDFSNHDNQELRRWCAEQVNGSFSMEKKITEAMKLEAYITGQEHRQERYDEPYPMTDERKLIQIDCRRHTCKYYLNGGDCSANAPAITLNERGTHVCGTHLDSNSCLSTFPPGGLVSPGSNPPGCEGGEHILPKKVTGVYNKDKHFVKEPATTPEEDSLKRSLDRVTEDSPKRCKDEPILFNEVLIAASKYGFNCEVRATDATVWEKGKKTFTGSHKDVLDYFSVSAKVRK